MSRKTWLDSKEAEDFIRWLKQEIQFAKDEWAEGRYTDGWAEATAILNANVIGQVQAFQRILDKLEEGENND